MTKVSVVRAYRVKYPDFPNLKLARIIYAENKQLFPSVEAIRTTIRTIQGQNGNSSSGIKKSHSQGPRPALRRLLKVVKALSVYLRKQLLLNFVRLSKTRVQTLMTTSLDLS